MECEGRLLSIISATRGRSNR